MDRERNPAAEDAFQKLHDCIKQSKKVQQQLEFFADYDCDLENELDHIEEQADSLIKTIGQTLLSARRFEEAMQRFERKTLGEED